MAATRSRSTKRRQNPERVVILGAAGRDFHDFNTVYRDHPEARVVAFTAAQIPGIEARSYPASLAGPHYPDGIPIVPEEELESVIRRERISQVVFAYSDITHARVMHLASRVLAAGADFQLLGPERTWVRASLPVIAVSAVRTGCGKSPTARYLSRRLRAKGLRTAVIRHPMPYGDLARQAVQRFAKRADLDAADCTIEEREEYEPHLEAGSVVYAGVDYAAIAEQAAAEADVLLWDGGNNDFPFLEPDLHVVLVDPLRPGHETTHHPGEAVLRMADVVVVSKTDSAVEEQIENVEATVRRIAPQAKLVRGRSPVTLDDEVAVRGKHVLVVEDGPSLTHGGMPFGAGFVAATNAGVLKLVDPRGVVAPEIAKVFEDYPHIGPVLPAVGYFESQLDALEQSINAVQADVVLSGTPADLDALLSLNKPVVRARYAYEEAAGPGLWAAVEEFLGERGISS